VTLEFTQLLGKKAFKISPKGKESSNQVTLFRSVWATFMFNVARSRATFILAQVAYKWRNVICTNGMDSNAICFNC